MGNGRTYRALWDAVVGVTAALLVFCAVPGVLVGLVGLPVPHRWSDHDVVSWHGLFDLLAIVSWCAWAACAWPVLRSVAVRVRSRDVDACARLTDRIAARITLGILVLASVLGLGMSVAGASVTRTPSPTSSLAVPGPTALAREVSPHAHAPTTDLRDAPPARRRPGTRRCVVGPGDTLPGLAATHYGDASDWPAIAASNLGRLMGDGTRFVDPAVVAPGWVFLLPALDAETRTHEEAVQPTSAASSAHADERGGAGSLGADSLVLPLAELGAAGLSALVAGLLARRTRQLRRLRAFLREEGETSSDPQEGEVELGALVAPFEQIPLVDMIEVAARDLRGAVATRGPAPGPVQWLRAGRDGVEVRFSDPVPQDVQGWRRTGHADWLLPATVDVAARGRDLVSGEPWCHVLLPIGDDHRGTWLLPLEAGSRVAVAGPRAPDFVLAMRAAVATWSWHEDLLVTESAEEVAHALRGVVRASTGLPAIASRVLFVGDPGALSSETRRECAVLTTRQVDAEVTVFVDDRAASAHPLGLTVRPPLLGAAWKEAVETLAGAGEERVGEEGAGPDSAGPTPTPTPRPLHDESLRPQTAPSGGPGDRGRARSLVHHLPPPVTVSVSGHDADPGTTAHPDLFSCASSAGAPAPHDGPRALAARARGRVEVRLLATLPGIVGLQAELPPKRARRALELIAYLAVNAPDPVTGDRLRTRVLGSPDADAAAKTLFNTVGAARRALGVAPDGAPLFPPASRSGHYRLSTWVTVDALRACTLVHEGLSSDQLASVARLREALELVRGEPLGGVLTGYAWWRAEGHERRVADAVVDGACALVRAALDAEDVDLARWAVEQARKVEPYSEALTRVAMRVAAASGDAHRLHAEWHACQRQVDDLDPGGAPSERTERLYALLRAQLAGVTTGSPQASFAAIDAAPLRRAPSAPSTV